MYYSNRILLINHKDIGSKKFYEQKRYVFTSSTAGAGSFIRKILIKFTGMFLLSLSIGIGHAENTGNAPMGYPVFGVFPKKSLPELAPKIAQNQIQNQIILPPNSTQANNNNSHLTVNVQKEVPTKTNSENSTLTNISASLKKITTTPNNSLSAQHTMPPKAAWTHHTVVKTDCSRAKLLTCKTQQECRNCCQSTAIGHMSSSPNTITATAKEGTTCHTLKDFLNPKLTKESNKIQLFVEWGIGVDVTESANLVRQKGKDIPLTADNVVELKRISPRKPYTEPEYKNE